MGAVKDIFVSIVGEGAAETRRFMIVAYPGRLEGKLSSGSCDSLQSVRLVVDDGTLFIQGQPSLKLSVTTGIGSGGFVSCTWGDGGCFRILHTAALEGEESNHQKLMIQEPYPHETALPFKVQGLLSCVAGLVMFSVLARSLWFVWLRAFSLFSLVAWALWVRRFETWISFFFEEH